MKALEKDNLELARQILSQKPEIHIEPRKG